MADQLGFTKQRVFDANGDPAAGAKVRFYQTNTTTPVVVYTTSALNVVLGQPVLSDADGYLPQVFVASGVIKAVVTDAADATLFTVDPCFSVTVSLSAASQVSFAPTAEIPVTNVQAAIERVQDNLEADTAGFTAALATKQPLDGALTTLSALALVAGDLLYATGAETVARLPAGTSGQLLRQGTGPAAPAWATVNATDFLGNLATTSGSTATMTPLVLTRYKFLRMVFNGVSPSSGPASINVGGQSVAVTVAAADTLRGFVDIDLTTGTGTSTLGSIGTGASAAAASRVINTTITTASTSVAVATTSGTFDAGSVDFYGMN